MLIDSGWKRWVMRDDEGEEPLPSPPQPDAHLRIVEAVVIATLSAVAGMAVEFFYEEFKDRRKALKEP
jgi:hypothetical protein